MQRVRQRRGGEELVKLNAIIHFLVCIQQIPGTRSVVKKKVGGGRRDEMRTLRFYRRVALLFGRNFEAKPRA